MINLSKLIADLIKSFALPGLGEVGFSDRFGASAAARRGFGENFLPRFHFALECFCPDGSLVWRRATPNVVTIVGRNDILDLYFDDGTPAGSPSSNWYIGLIDNGGSVSENDTMSSHAGWSEFTNYDEATRPAIAFSAASAGNKSTSAASSFTINATGEVDGAFIVNQNTKSGTTGIVFSAGTFTGAPVASGYTLNVTGQYTTSGS